MDIRLPSPAYEYDDPMATEEAADYALLLVDCETLYPSSTLLVHEKTGTARTASLLTEVHEGYKRTPAKAFRVCLVTLVMVFCLVICTAAIFSSPDGYSSNPELNGAFLLLMLCCKVIGMSILAAWISYALLLLIIVIGMEYFCT